MTVVKIPQHLQPHMKQGNVKKLLQKLVPSSWSHKVPMFRKAYTGEEIFDAVKASLNQHIKTEPRRKFEISLGVFRSASFKINDTVVLPLLDRVIRLVCVTCDADNISIGIYKKSHENVGFVALLFDGKKPNVKNDVGWGDAERGVFYPLVQDANNLRCRLFWNKLHGPLSLHFEFPLKPVEGKGQVETFHSFPTRS